MDRYYTMRPINLSGEVSGYRAELIGVGAGADALRTIMQNAIQRVGVSITPIVCQQLFVEVFNAAVDFACDSGTSVNLADIISFKWNTRGKYDRIDATVPKSALSLTAIVSPKITRNATPHFELKAQPLTPTLTYFLSPFDYRARGTVGRGMSLANLHTIRFVDVNNPSTIYAHLTRGAEFTVSSNGREVSKIADAVIDSAIPQNARALIQLSVEDSPDVFAGSLVVEMNPYSAEVRVDSATPQPFDINGDDNLVITGSGFDRVEGLAAYTLEGVRILDINTGAYTEDQMDVSVDSFTPLAPWSGGPLVIRFYPDVQLVGNPLASFNVNFAAFSL